MTEFVESARVSEGFSGRIRRSPGAAQRERATARTGIEVIHSPTLHLDPPGESRTRLSCGSHSQGGEAARAV